MRTRIAPLPLVPVIPVVLWALLAGPRPADAGTGPAQAKADETLTFYITGDIHGTPEPCGCTSVPLGNVARVAALVKAAPGRTQLLDAGGLRYGVTLPAGDQLAQARLKADFLEHTWEKLGALVAVQPEDLLDGTAPLGKVPGRLACNLTLPGVPGDHLRGTAMVRVGGVQVGVIGVAPSEGPWPAGVTALDPRATAQAVQKAAAGLRQKGAALVVALTGLPRPRARQLGYAVTGVDVVVAGDHLEEPVAEPEVVGKALLVLPMEEAKQVVRLVFHLHDGRPVVRYYRDAGGQKREAERLQRYRDRISGQLAELAKDPKADPAYVARLRQELATTGQALSRTRVVEPPPRDGYVTMELLPMGAHVPKDPEVAQAMIDLDRRIGEENLKRVTAPPPPPQPGQPAYVGNAGCLGSCHIHEDALAHWQHTVHGHAWKTLVDVGKQLSYDCVSCHATGFGEPGGSNLLTLVAADRGRLGAGRADLRNVGCEVCHGPGSLHVRSPAKVDVPVPRPGEQRCRDCHTPMHSDTFQFAPYLRDILGPGHGEDRRKELGPGPTGAQLRKAAVEKGM